MNPDKYGVHSVRREEGGGGSCGRGGRAELQLLRIGTGGGLRGPRGDRLGAEGGRREARGRWSVRETDSNAQCGLKLLNIRTRVTVSVR